MDQLGCMLAGATARAATAALPSGCGAKAATAVAACGLLPSTGHGHQLCVRQSDASNISRRYYQYSEFWRVLRLFCFARPRGIRHRIQLGDDQADWLLDTRN